MAWKDQMSQPRSDMEAGNIAAEAMGGETKGKPRAPRFHRMSIEAAANGVTINHTVKVPVKQGKTKGEQFPGGGASPSLAGSDGERHVETQGVFGHDHPIMQHVHAIHKHMHGIASANGALPGDEDGGD